ncbi:MAG: hypothetical protein R3C59_30410 [Planctomycetaceae bacterium]
MFTAFDDDPAGFCIRNGLPSGPADDGITRSAGYYVAFGNHCKSNRMFGRICISGPIDRRNHSVSRTKSAGW